MRGCIEETTFQTPKMHANRLDDLREKLTAHFRPVQRSFQFWVRAADIYTGYKVAQIIGKPDLAPPAWVRRLITLCDRAPATPFEVVQLVLERELGCSVGEVFERFDAEPLGSASIAQVHRARLKGAKGDVAVKVQHPGGQDLMMTDIHNLQAFALYLQKSDIKFDLFSVTQELEKQIGYEFDFLREAEAMERIQRFLCVHNKKPPVLVPSVVRNMVTRKVLVMDFVDGIPILNLGDEIAKRGINPGGKVWLQQSNPHPGNILICKGSQTTSGLVLLNMILVIADDDPTRASQSYRQLGIETLSKCKDEQKEMLKLAQSMFDTKLPAGSKMLQPFSEDSSLKKKIAVRIPCYTNFKNYGRVFQRSCFVFFATVHLLRGLSVGKDLKGMVHKRGFVRRIFG
ncbi:hypothetical protein IFM89_030455 [Coptis chinensis]|uniref:ABC1 atypical kinase-like domain-containing protein n=1 Tax=Coptis chinensis TaxID=261450 RepID=A0A835LP29_9MAGN|nr:hypothetical protein IFM89_030455 [Coptis chinensis]